MGRSLKEEVVCFSAVFSPSSEIYFVIVSLVSVERDPRSRSI